MVRFDTERDSRGYEDVPSQQASPGLRASRAADPGCALPPGQTGSVVHEGCEPWRSQQGVMQTH